LCSSLTKKFFSFGQNKKKEQATNFSSEINQEKLQLIPKLCDSIQKKEFIQQFTDHQKNLKSNQIKVVIISKIIKNTHREKQTKQQNIFLDKKIKYQTRENVMKKK